MRRPGAAIVGVGSDDNGSGREHDLAQGRAELEGVRSDLGEVGASGGGVVLRLFLNVSPGGPRQYKEDDLNIACLLFLPLAHHTYAPIP